MQRKDVHCGVFSIYIFWREFDCEMSGVSKMAERFKLGGSVLFCCYIHSLNLSTKLVLILWMIVYLIVHFICLFNVFNTSVFFVFTFDLLLLLVLYILFFILLLFFFFHTCSFFICLHLSVSSFLSLNLFSLSHFFSFDQLFFLSFFL